MEIRIRTETTADYPEIDEVVRQAFGPEGAGVADLIDLIRKSPNYIPELSLVAETKGKIVGHILLSHLLLEDGRTSHRVVVLSPLAVSPDSQRKGVGSALVRSAIEKADQLGEPLIVLEGIPSYYPRFGFQLAKTLGVRIDLPAWAPDEAAMVYPLGHYRPDIRGKVVYPPAFEKVNAADHARK